MSNDETPPVSPLLDDRPLEVLIRLREAVRRVDGVARAHPVTLLAMPASDLIELAQFLEKFQPVLSSTAREFGNLQGRVAKALKRRRAEMRA